jgi:Protein of unknown function (DUF3306)
MMSDQENFIARWSRRKREATEDAEGAKSAGLPGGPEVSAEAGKGGRHESDPAPVEVGVPQPSEIGFDLTKLPSIETITAGTDIRAFLAPGVPAEMTRAALRRAWTSDPNIRDFVGLSENSWDFNAPDTIAGFGKLEITDELKAQVMRMLGGGGAAESPQTAPSSPQLSSTQSQGRIESAEIPEALSRQGVEVPGAAESTQKPLHAAEGLPHSSEPPVAPHNNLENSDKAQLIARRPHGGALPR